MFPKCRLLRLKNNSLSVKLGHTALDYTGCQGYWPTQGIGVTGLPKESELQASPGVRVTSLPRELGLQADTGRRGYWPIQGVGVTGLPRESE